MNVNESQHVFGRRGYRARGRGARQLRVVTVQESVMGPPSRPAPKRKETSSEQTPTTSSRINWKSHPPSTSIHNSTNARTTPSSRSRSTSESESRVILALTEGRGEATCEVGIAAIDVARPSLILCQISDSQSYINTLSKINILNPSEILIPLTFVETFSSNRLLEKVKEHFHYVKITGVTRTTFNKSSGLQYLRQLCVPSMNSVLLVLQHRYYALTAAGALLTYLESSLYVFYVNESIKIEYQESEGSTIIDVATAGSLELVASARPTLEKRYSCLWDVLNHCKTKIGARTLRASILQPPCSVPEIEARLECVAELKEHLDTAIAIQALLLKLSNIDQLLSLAIVLPDQAQNCSGRQLNYLLLLNTVLEQLTPLRQILDGSQQAFFVELRATLENPAFTTIKELMRALIHTDAHSAKGQYGTYQRCFAIKSGVNGLLDLIRKSYSERLDDMRGYVKDLGEKYMLAMTLNYNDKKGYHIVLSLNGRQKKTFKKTDLPAEFIQVERLSNSCTMKTLELITLSNRVEDIMMEILKMSNIMIYKLLIDVRGHMGIFYKLCEDVAKLDMLLSLANASSAIHYVRPKFSNYMEVVHSRHPLLDFLCASEPISNSIYASNDYNMNIITGPNGSGKSIFIRQVLLIQVMAQVGCYVPAQSATLRVSDRILARVSLGDDLESGASAFVLEMKEIQYFFNVLTKNTLIIIDELCRSTALEEGTALAMAVCEELMKTPAFVFFTTHFKLLAKLGDLHLNVKTWQLETLTEMKNDQSILRFTYSVVPGVTSLEHYGLFLAKGSWPENMIRYAEEVLEMLASTRQRQPPHVRQASAAARLKYDLEAELRMLKAKKQLTRTLIEDKLKQYESSLNALHYNVELALDQANTTDNQFRLATNENNHENGHGSTYVDGARLGGPLNEDGHPDYYNFQDLNFINDTDCVGDDFSEPNFNLPGPNQKPMGYFNFETNEVLPTYHDQSRAISNPTLSASMTQCSQSLYLDVPQFPDPLDNSNQEPHPEEAFSGNHQMFSHYPNGSFDFQPSLAVQNQNVDHSQNLSLSYSNVLEPEVILKANSDLSFYSCRSKPFMEECDALHHQSAVFGKQLSANIQTDLVAFQPNQVLYETSPGPKENPIAFGDNSLLSIFGTQPSQQYDHRSAPNHYEEIERFTEVNQAVPAADSGHNESTSSISEHQFSIPLQQNALRTSTPIPNDLQGYTQAFPRMTQFGRALVTSKTNEHRTTSSGSITWGAGHQQRPPQNMFVTLTSVTTPQKFGTVLTSADCKSQQAKTNEQRSPSSESITWGAGHQQRPPQNMFVTPTTVSTSQKLGISSTSNDVKSQQAKTNEQRSPSSESITWGAGHQQRPPQNMFVTSTTVTTPQKLGTRLTSNEFKLDQPKTNEQRSTSSESITWGADHQRSPPHNMLVAPTTATTPQKFATDSAFDDFKSQQAKTNEQRSVSSGSITWAAAHQQRPLQNVFVTPTTVKTPQKCGTTSSSSDLKSKQGTPSSTKILEVSVGNSYHCSDADISDAINDLQSCGEDFSQEWDGDVDVHRKIPSKGVSCDVFAIDKSEGGGAGLKTIEDGCNKTNSISVIWTKKDDGYNTVAEAIDDLQSCSDIFSQAWDYNTQDSQVNTTSNYLEAQPKQLEEITVAVQDPTKKDDEEPIQHNHNLIMFEASDAPAPKAPKAVIILQNILLASSKQAIEDKSITPTKMLMETHIDTKCVHLESQSSLEPLGDVHLELFSDSSIADETQEINDADVAAPPPTLSHKTANPPTKPPTLSFITQIEVNKLNSNRAELCSPRASPQHIKTIDDLKKSTVNPVAPPSTLSSTKTQHTASVPPMVEIDESNSLAPPPTWSTTPQILEPRASLNESSQEDLFCTAESMPESHEDKPSPKKRKRLGYVNTTSKKSTPIAASSSDQRSMADEAANQIIPDDIFEQSTQETPWNQDGTIKDLEGTESTNSKVTKTTASIDVCGDAPNQPLDTIRIVSPTPSDFEHSQKPGVKKRKWTPPFKTNVNKQKVLKKKRSMLTAPKKLTKKEIEEAFYEQDKRMLESENPSQYLEQILNRPSVKQMQQAKHVLSIRRTGAGVVVSPIEERKPKARKRFVIPLKGKSETFTPLLCDENSHMFEEFINSGRKTPFVRQEVGIVQSKIVTRTNNESSQVDLLGQVGREIGSLKLEQPSTSGIQRSVSQKAQGALPKQGHYTQNKDLIENLIDKYLNPPATSTSLKIFPQDVNSSFFSQLSASLEDN